MMNNSFSVSIFSPTPVFPHFVWPLSFCIQADICNHTWIPECGSQTTKDTDAKDFRLFIDECDMFEYNCDQDVEYKIANYSDCFGYVACATPATKKYYRMGNYRFELEGRKIIYEPTERSRPTYNPVSLPAHMLKGKRRYTPEVRRRMLRQKRLQSRTTKKVANKKVGTQKKPTKKTTTATTTEKTETYIIKKETVVINGKKALKVVKGYRKVTTPMADSDFLQ